MAQTQPSSSCRNVGIHHLPWSLKGLQMNRSNRYKIASNQTIVHHHVSSLESKPSSVSRPSVQS